MRRLIIPVFVLAGWMLLTPTPSTAANSDVDVTVRIDTATLLLGENVDAQIDITNTAAEPTDSLVVHIDITDPSNSRSVDPEDWTSELTRPLGVIAPGETVSVTWTLQPIAEGEYAFYAVTLASDATTLAASNVAHLRVTAQRSLNPGGILPVAIGAPTLVGGLLIFQIRSARRNHPSPAAP